MLEICKGKEHSWKRIYTHPISIFGDKCIEWCEVCGAVQIQELDNGKLMYESEIQIPKVTKVFKKDS